MVGCSSINSLPYIYIYIHHLGSGHGARWSKYSSGRRKYHAQTYWANTVRPPKRSAPHPRATTDLRLLTSLTATEGLRERPENTPKQPSIAVVASWCLWVLLRCAAKAYFTRKENDPLFAAETTVCCIVWIIGNTAVPSCRGSLEQ